MVAEISFSHREKPSLRLMSCADLLIACSKTPDLALAGSDYIQIPELGSLAGQAHTRKVAIQHTAVVHAVTDRQQAQELAALLTRHVHRNLEVQGYKVLLTLAQV